MDVVSSASTPPTANPAFPTANPAPAPLRSSSANFFRFLLCAAIPLAVLITILHSSGCVHPTNPFALPRTFNFTAPSAKSYNLTADFPRKIQPTRKKHPLATRNKHLRAKNKTPTPPATNKTGESLTPTTHAPHSTTSEAVSVLVLYQARIGIFIPIAPVCATGISILVVDTMVKNGDAINNYLANVDLNQAHVATVLIGSIIGEGIAIIVPYMWPENQLTTSLSMILLVATIALCCLFGDLKLVNKVVGAAACLTMVEICAFGLKKNLGNLSVACLAGVYCIFSLVLVTRGDAPPLYRRL